MPDSNAQSPTAVIDQTATVKLAIDAATPLSWRGPSRARSGRLKRGDPQTGDIGHLIVNDGLMTVFFFVVGLEGKREMVHGELRDPRRNALLPLFAALGGVLMPAAFYLALQWGEPGQRGWAVPMATDIAFVVGVLALFGTCVPFGLKILLLSLAIVDDLVAVRSLPSCSLRRVGVARMGRRCVRARLCVPPSGVRSITRQRRAKQVFRRTRRCRTHPVRRP